jgi:hypothetical protein
MGRMKKGMELAAHWHNHQNLPEINQYVLQRHISSIQAGNEPVKVEYIDEKE